MYHQRNCIKLFLKNTDMENKTDMIEYADTPKELWDLMSSFVKIHKHNLDELDDVFDKFFEEIETHC